MAGIAPLFSTAPRIKLKINQENIAFAIGMNINVSVDIQPVQILGKFGPVSTEPTMYNTVSGTMQIIRVISSEDLASTAAALNDPANAALNQGNPLVKSADGESTLEAGSAVTEFGSNNPLVQNSIIRHMDPRSVLLSTTFDMELFMRVPDPSKTGVTEALDQDNTNDPAVGVLDVNSADGGLIEVPWMTIRQCRITSRNINISVGQLVNEPVSFQGIFLTTKNLEKNDMMFQDIGPEVTPDG